MRSVLLRLRIQPSNLGENRSPPSTMNPPRLASSPSFTRGEYWILETLVEALTPFRFFFFDGNQQDVTETFNKPSHGLSRDGLIEVFTSLFERRLIEAYKGESRHPSVLSSQEIATAIEEPACSLHYHNTVCGLTPLGGNYWEAFAAPDWSRFLDASFTEAEGGGDWQNAEIIGEQRELIQRYVRVLRQRGMYIEKSTIEWHTVRPWRATYWKILPQARRMTFLLKDIYELHPPEIVAALSGETYDNRWYRWM